jgi:hypothetical protein
MLSARLFHFQSIATRKCTNRAVKDYSCCWKKCAPHHESMVRCRVVFFLVLRYVPHNQPHAVLILIVSLGGTVEKAYARHDDGSFNHESCALHTAGHRIALAGSGHQDVGHFYVMLVLNRMVGYHARCVIGEGQMRVGLIGRLVISAQLYLND